MSHIRPTVRVAVVGSGLAALTAAYRLANDTAKVDFEVHVFEKVCQVSLITRTVSITQPVLSCSLLKSEWTPVR